MTNFIYNMQDELFHLNMILPVGDFSTIKKLVDHIEAQGKQLRELNAAIEKYAHKNKDLQERNALLVKKVDELNEGIRNSEDLTWKQKYDDLLQSSEQAIGALQKKCQEYKNSESDATANTIVALIGENQKLFHENNKLKEDLEKEKQVSKDLNVIINSKNKLLDEYMTKCNNLERNYNEEVRMKEQFKSICFRHERTIESQNSTIKYLKGQVADYVRLNSVLRGKLVSIGELANKINDVNLSEE